jgi:MFS family permease
MTQGTDAGGQTPAAAQRPGRLPAGIWALGLTSLLMDASSELVHSLLPVFLTTVLGVGMIAIGFIEGVAEAIAAVTRVFSGTLSDHWRRRKPLVVLGYGLAALTKPVFPLAASIGWVIAARFVDRIGKGIRGAPRDALIADIVPAHSRGAAYGLRQALDSVGGFAGPALALLFMSILGGDIRAVLWVATVPALASVLLLVFFVREPARPPAAGASSGERPRISWRGATALQRRYWLVVALAMVFTLARFSEAFLILRALHVGLSPALVPLVTIVMSVVYAAAAYPAGRASDRLDRRALLLAGLVVLIAADLVLAFASSVALLLAGSALWGLHMALTQGLFAKLVADEAPAELRGTAFGVFHVGTGLSLLIASVIAGSLWSCAGPSATFLAGAGFAGIAALGLVVTTVKPRARGRRALSGP